jgi:serine/threonine protein kinase
MDGGYGSVTQNFQRWSPGASFKRRRIKLFSGSQIGSWRKGQLIGKGATGAVYEAVDEATDSYFAVKEIEFAEDFADNPEERRRFEALRDEVSLLQSVDHPNVVRFLGIDRVGFNMYIMMDFVAGGSIHSLIKRFSRLSEELTIKYATQLVAGLAYLHSKSIIHRDIKGANILVSDDGVVKLADFGAAKRIIDPEQLQHTLAGTPYWMAPEVVRQQGHAKPADVWSLGATVLQMLTGMAPYQDLAPVPALFRIGHGSDSPVPPNARMSPLARDFVCQCLTRDAALRPTVEQLEVHPWLENRRPSPIAPQPTAAAASTNIGEDADESAAEADVTEYLIALSFTHDDDVAAMAAGMYVSHQHEADAAPPPPPPRSDPKYSVVRAVTFDAPSALDGRIGSGPEDELPPGEFDEEQFNAFVSSLSHEQQQATQRGQ